MLPVELLTSEKGLEWQKHPQNVGSFGRWVFFLPDLSQGRGQAREAAAPCVLLGLWWGHCDFPSWVTATSRDGCGLKPILPIIRAIGVTCSGRYESRLTLQAGSP